MGWLQREGKNLGICYRRYSSYWKKMDIGLDGYKNEV